MHLPPGRLRHGRDELSTHVCLREKARYRSEDCLVQVEEPVGQADEDRLESRPDLWAHRTNLYGSGPPARRPRSPRQPCAVSGALANLPRRSFMERHSARVKVRLIGCQADQQGRLARVRESGTDLRLGTRQSDSRRMWSINLWDARSYSPDACLYASSTCLGIRPRTEMLNPFSCAQFRKWADSPLIFVLRRAGSSVDIDSSLILFIDFRRSLDALT